LHEKDFTMSLASDWAATEATAIATQPTGFVGPGGLMRADVSVDGNCIITLEGRKFPLPVQIGDLFVDWWIATFRNSP
jgi:hypothetical protein